MKSKQVGRPEGVGLFAKRVQNGCKVPESLYYKKSGKLLRKKRIGNIEGKSQRRISRWPLGGVRRVSKLAKVA